MNMNFNFEEMLPILRDIGKGLLFMCAVMFVLWTFAQGLMITYAVMGDNIGFLALVPTVLVLAYLYGHAISAQKDLPH